MNKEIARNTIKNIKETTTLDISYANECLLFDFILEAITEARDIEKEIQAYADIDCNEEDKIKYTFSHKANEEIYISEIINTINSINFPENSEWNYMFGNIHIQISNSEQGKIIKSGIGLTIEEITCINKAINLDQDEITCLVC
jgi:hypothetical protein